MFDFHGSFYMDATRLRGISSADITGTVAALYPALLPPVLLLRACTESAEPRLIFLTSSSLLEPFRFRRSRSDLCCHYSRFPTQPSTFTFQNQSLRDVYRFVRPHAHVTLLVRSITSQLRPNCPRDRVCQRDDNYVRMSPLLQLLGPLARLVRMVQDAAGTVNQ